MKNRLTAWLLNMLLAGGVTPAAATPPAQASQFAFTHVTVIDVTGGPSLTDMTVVVTGDRITALGKWGETVVPEGARVINAAGKFLIPGLWDMHAHAIFYTSGEVEQLHFPSFVVSGVTGVREMGSLHPISQFNRWRAGALKGELLMPRVVLGRMVGSGHDSSLAIQVADEGEARAAVRRIKQEGYDFVKPYSGLSRAEYFAVADEARRLGLTLAGHVPTVMNAGEASDAGLKSIEHMTEVNTSASSAEEEFRAEELAFPRRHAGLKGWDMDRERLRFGRRLLDSYSGEKEARLFARFARNGTWLCPTLVVFRAYAMVNDPALYEQNDARFRYVSARRKQKDRRKWDEMRNHPPEWFEMSRRAYELRLRQVGAARRAGAGLLAGTDTDSVSSAYPFAGFSLHDELELLVRAGLTPLEALQTATLNPARYLGLGASLGTVERGKLADLVLLDADPLHDISNTRRIDAVVLNGRLIGSEELSRILTRIEAAAQAR